MGMVCFGHRSVQSYVENNIKSHPSSQVNSSKRHLCPTFIGGILSTYSFAVTHRILPPIRLKCIVMGTKISLISPSVYPFSFHS